MQEIKDKVQKLSKMLKKAGITHQELADYVGIKRPMVTMAMSINSTIKVWDGAESLIKNRIEELNVWEKNQQKSSCY